MHKDSFLRNALLINVAIGDELQATSTKLKKR